MEWRKPQASEQGSVGVLPAPTCSLKIDMRTNFEKSVFGFLRLKGAEYIELYFTSSFSSSLFYSMVWEFL